MGGHDHASLSAGRANEFEHLFVAVEWLGSPVLGNFGEQAVLDGIPLGGASRVVSDGDGDAEGIAYLSLKSDLPGPGSATVAAAGVGQNQEFGGAAIAMQPLPSPPGGNRMSSEGRRVVRDADADSAAVVGRVVNAIGDSYPDGIGAEVVIVYQDRRAVPFGTAVFEVADHLTLLTVDADDGEALSLKTSPERADMLELLIAVGAGVGGDLLAVDAQGEVHLVEQTSHRIGRDRDIDLLENLRDLLGRLASPLQSGDRIPGGIVLQKNLDGVDYFGRFFSTRLRPAPALRARSTSTS
jgi:hypothetical protein